MEQLIELLKQIQELAGVAIDALEGAAPGGEGPAETATETGEGGAGEGAPPGGGGGGQGGPAEEMPPGQ